MSDLRKEYDKHKQEKTEMIEEASTQWVKKNIVIIHERVGRNVIKSLQDKIVKFDQEFGEFKSQLPAVADQIANAELSLQKVTTGRANEDKAMKLLKQLAYLYRTYSEFFNQDMSVLIGLPSFRAAKENPEVKLNVLQAPGHDPSVIRDIFKDRLKPSAKEAQLIKAIHRGKQPIIDSNAIATQLLNLSFNELEQLTRIEKVPMVDYPEADAEEDTTNLGLGS